MSNPDQEIAIPVALQRAFQHHQAGRLPEAEAIYRQVLAMDPDSFDALYLLGMIACQVGRYEQGIELISRAIRQFSLDPLPHFNLGEAYRMLNRFEEAEASYQKTLALKPDLAEAHVGLGHALKERGLLDEAEACFQKALLLKPDMATVHYGLGVLFQDRGRFGEAEDCYRKALALHPDYAEAHNNLGNLLKAYGRLEEAEACYRKALALRPDLAELHNNLGSVLKELGRLEEAEACYRKALALKPGMALAHYNLGTVLKNRGRLDEAVASYQTALAHKPDYADARWGLTMAWIPEVCGPNDSPETGREKFTAELAELEAWYDKNRVPQAHISVGLHQPFYLAYQEQNNRDLFSQYGILCARLMEGANIVRGGETAKKSVPEKIKVGIVSAHLYDQSVWNAIVKSWYLHLDRNQFELETFCVGTRQDGVTAWAKSQSAWFEQGAKNLNQWVEVIQARQPDVLVYPEIGMDPMTVRLASLRLAPIQAVAWGHPETSGLPTIDYYLSAEDFEPANAQENYSEKLVCLPHLGCCYQPSSVAAAAPDFDSLNIESGVPVFICPGTPFKYAPRHDRVFVEIAKRAKQCQFVFFRHGLVSDLTEKLRRRLETFFAQSGMDFNEYAVFLPWQSRPAFHGLMQRADVYLDTIGFSGFNTAMQAVECGLPIVTREGRFMRGRLASGILRRLGLPELIAETEEDYIALVLKLAQDGDYRQKIRECMESARHVLHGDLAPIRAFEEFLLKALTQSRT